MTDLTPEQYKQVRQLHLTRLEFVSRIWKTLSYDAKSYLCHMYNAAGAEYSDASEIMKYYPELFNRLASQPH